MASYESIGGRPHVNGKFVHGARCHKGYIGGAKSCAISGLENSGGHPHFSSIGENIHELDSEIGIGAVGSDEEGCIHTPDNLYRICQRSGVKREDIGAVFIYRGLIACPVFCLEECGASTGRNRVGGIVAIGESRSCFTNQKTVPIISEINSGPSSPSLKYLILNQTIATKATKGLRNSPKNC